MVVAQPLLSEGATGGAVKELQQLLKEKKINVVVDGVFGPNTKKAVQDFQKSKGLSVDGIVGPKTWEALRQGEQKPTTPPIKLVDVAQYYDSKQYPHQKQALEWLESQIPQSTLEEFAKRWREKK